MEIKKYMGKKSTRFVHKLVCGLSCNKSEFFSKKAKILFVVLLMLVAAIAINAGDVLFRDGSLDINQDLRVNTDTLYVDSTRGSVGIGTAGPSGRLSIQGKVPHDGNLTFFDSLTADMIFDGGDDSLFFFKNTGASTGLTSFLRSDGTHQFTITNTGNVGIGTSGPLTKLHVEGPTILGGTGSETGRIRTVFDYWGGYNDALIIEKTDDDSTVEGGMIFGFSTSAGTNIPPTSPDWAVSFTPALTIKGNGNVGIGTTDPAGYRLNVVGAGGDSVDLRVNGRIRTGDASRAGGIWLGTDDTGFVGETGANIGFWTSGVGWNAFQIEKATGEVGIGTTDPTSTLHVVGEAYVSGISGDGSGKVVCIKSDGRLGTCSDQPGAGGACTCG